MAFAEKDIFILSNIYLSALKKERVTTWTLAKKYPWEDKRIFKSKSEEIYYYTTKSLAFSDRLKIMAKKGIIEINKDKYNKNVYTLIGDKVVMKKYEMPITKKRRNTIAILENNKWNIFEL